jgi:hypothetical protein
MLKIAVFGLEPVEEFLTANFPEFHILTYFPRTWSKIIDAKNIPPAITLDTIAQTTAKTAILMKTLLYSATL